MAIENRLLAARCRRMPVWRRRKRKGRDLIYSADPATVMDFYLVQINIHIIDAPHKSPIEFRR